MRNRLQHLQDVTNNQLKASKNRARTGYVLALYTKNNATSRPYANRAPSYPSLYEDKTNYIC